MLSKRRVLMPCGVVSVLPCIGSQTHSTVRPVRCGPPRRAAAASSATLSAPMRWISVIRAGLALRIEHVEQADQPVGRHRRADLDAERIVECRGGTRRARRRAAPCACRSTGSASTGCTSRGGAGPGGSAPARTAARAPRGYVKKSTRRSTSASTPVIATDEVERVADRIDDALVLLRVRRALRERDVPVFGVVEVGEPAVEQRADEVERQARALVRAQHQHAGRARDPRR